MCRLVARGDFHGDTGKIGSPTSLGQYRCCTYPPAVSGSLKTNPSPFSRHGLSDVVKSSLLEGWLVVSCTVDSEKGMDQQSISVALFWFPW